jgi:uncharacterized membrane protein
MRALVRPGLGLLPGIALALAAAFGCGNGEDPEGSGGNSAGGGPSWCQVSGVLAAKCVRCHVGEGLNGAPFPLVTYDDTQVVDAPGVRWVRMQEMVQVGAMPPLDAMVSPPVQPLTANEKAVLVEWFEAGAEPVGGTDCP